MALCLVHRFVPIFSVKESEAHSRWLPVPWFPFHLHTSLSTLYFPHVSRGKLRTPLLLLEANLHPPLVPPGTGLP